MTNKRNNPSPVRNIKSNWRPGDHNVVRPTVGKVKGVMPVEVKTGIKPIIQILVK